MSSNEIVEWSPREPSEIANADGPQAIVQFATPQLSTRDMNAIALAFQNETYEMAATFVWAKASSVLKKQVSTLGMEFVGEMLGRPDLNEDSDPATSISDHEAITLAEDLGMISTTQGLRLKHSLELVTHFTQLDLHEGEDEFLTRDEALMVLKSCVTSILSVPKLGNAVRFAEFRHALTERTLRAEDDDVARVVDSSYFFIRTTLSVLLSLVKTTGGASQEHAIGNFSVLLPLLWDQLRRPERWMIGQAYADVNAKGDSAAATGLRKTLLKVHGFDFVPENLRSSTFTAAAARVLSAHFAFNNFANEVPPMRTLADLGTAIPHPAFAKCMEAVLAVWLGNAWGHSFSACSHAQNVLDSLRKDQWEYYLNECLRRDRTVLDKLADHGKPVERWVELVKKYHLDSYDVPEGKIRRLLVASAGQHASQSVPTLASDIRKQATK